MAVTRADIPAFVTYDANVDGQNFNAGNTKNRLKDWGDDFRDDVQTRITDHEIGHLDGWIAEATPGEMLDRATWLRARLVEFRPDIVTYVATVKGNYDARIDVLDTGAADAKTQVKLPITRVHYADLRRDWPRVRSARLQVWEIVNPGDPDIPTSVWWRAVYDELGAKNRPYAPSNLIDPLDPQDPGPDP